MHFLIHFSYILRLIIEKEFKNRNKKKEIKLDFEIEVQMIF